MRSVSLRTHQIVSDRSPANEVFDVLARRRVGGENQDRDGGNNERIFDHRLPSWSAIQAGDESPTAVSEFGDHRNLPEQRVAEAEQRTP